MNQDLLFNIIDKRPRENYFEGYSYIVSPDSPQTDINFKILDEVFLDPILSFKLDEKLSSFADYFMVVIGFKPGVTDNPARSAKMALNLFSLNCDVYSYKTFLVKKDQYQNLDVSNYFNPLIHNLFKIDLSDVNSEMITYFNKPIVSIDNSPSVNTIDLSIDETDFNTLNKERCLALTFSEFQTIQEYYNKSSVKAKRSELGLPDVATDVEIEILSQSWSEHCKHKIFNADIDFDNDGRLEKVKSLFKTYVKKTTDDVIDRFGIDWAKSLFHDNAGIVRFDKNIDLCFKVETHNSPSALDPYGGALTGILGVNRDILGCGIGAKPIANTNFLCFSDPNSLDENKDNRFPVGHLEPRKILSGVHKGIEDGGNKSGIPTVNGGFFFDDSYAGKPLVYCGTLGVLPHNLKSGADTFFKCARPNDLIVIAGGSVGADGIHGATFSSLELNEHSPATAVQIGDPLTQKLVSDFTIAARDQELFTSITDNGAGGLSSSIGEMAEQAGGACIDLALCPLKYSGLSPWEIMISESQERITYAVPPEKFDQFSKLASLYKVSIVNLGTFNDSGLFHIKHNDETVAALDLDFIHNGLSNMKLEAKWSNAIKYSETSWSNRKTVDSHSVDLKTKVYRVLSSPNICSKKHFISQFDQEVQGATVLKPFFGDAQNNVNNCGGIDLSVFGGEEDNIALLSCGTAPRLAYIDPFLMGQASVDEALRNLICHGVNLEKVCALDNFSWPDPVWSENNPDGKVKLGALVLTARGMQDACLSYGIPLVSGKDSMKNDFIGKDKSGERVKISANPTLLVSALGVTDRQNIIQSKIVDSDSHLYLLGDDKVNCLTGSEFSLYFNVPDTKSHPKFNTKKQFELYKKISSFTSIKEVDSIHDLSEGGLLACLCEMFFDTDFGITINCCEKDVDGFLFSEYPGRFLLNVKSKFKNKIEQVFKDEFTYLGQVNLSNNLIIGSDHKVIMQDSFENLKSAWMNSKGEF